MRLASGSRVESAMVIAAFTIAAIVFALALFGDFLVPNPPAQASLLERLKPPAWLDGGSWTYPLGTDSLGRCILSRIMSGAKYAIGISVLSIILSAILGVALGLVSGYFGGWLDAVIMRLVDLTLAFPLLLLGLMVAMTLGQSSLTLLTVLVFVQTGRFARQIRGEALLLQGTDFVALARIADCSTARILWRHLLPNVTNTVLVLMTLQVGWAIVVESSLSFLGAGIPSPAPGWGLMVADGRDYLERAWWVSGLPGAAIMLTVLAFNTIGDWLRDRLDPRLRQM